MTNTNILPITVAIPTMNRPQTLQRTLQSYLDADYLPAQIIVVDQSPTEEMQTTNKQLLTQLPKEIQASYIYQNIPSLTKARNQALTATTNDILVCSDDDVDVYKDTLKNVYDLFQNPQIAMVAGLDDCAPTSNTSKMGYLLGTKSFFKRNMGHVTTSMLGRFPKGTIKGEVPTQWAMGFFFAVRTPLLKKWGITWDEHLTSYAYSEDLDFSYTYYKQAKQEGLQCVFSDKVHVKHLVSREYRTPSKKSTYMYVCNRYYLAHKHGKGRAGNLAMTWCNLWMLLVRIIKKQTPQDMWNAMVYCHQNRHQIKNGEIKLP